MFSLEKHRNTILPESPIQFVIEDVIKYWSMNGRTKDLDEDILTCEYISFLDDYKNGYKHINPFVYKIYLYVIRNLYLKSFYEYLHQKTVTL